jgi:hypothetical protein
MWPNKLVVTKVKMKQEGASETNSSYYESLKQNSDEELFSFLPSVKRDPIERNFEREGGGGLLLPTSNTSRERRNRRNFETTTTWYITSYGISLLIEYGVCPCNPGGDLVLLLLLE